MSVVPQAYAVDSCKMLYLLLAALKLSIELCDDLVGQHRRFVGRCEVCDIRGEGRRYSTRATLARIAMARAWKARISVSTTPDLALAPHTIFASRPPRL